MTDRARHQAPGTEAPENLPDAEARDAILNDLDSTMVVEAAAGTGKTTALVGRIVRGVEAGKADLKSIVAVTFTEKAAGELKLRLREALEQSRVAAPDPARRRRLDEQLATLEEAHVSTIHGFCAELLRERPVEARVDPLFRVLTEPQAQRLYDEAFDRWLQDRLEDPPEGIRRALRRSTFGDEDPAERLRGAGRQLVEWRDFPERWTREPFDRAAEIRRLVEQLGEFCALSASPSYARDSLFVDTEAARRLQLEIALQAGAGSADLDGWESRLLDLSRNRAFRNAKHGRGPDYRKGVLRAGVVAAYEALRDALDRFRAAADADLAALLRDELAGSIDAYDAMKARAGALDFLDLLLKARDLVRDNAEVRRHFQARFARIFVDEFQDTDPLQAELLLLLCADDPAETDWRRARPVAGKLFIVGDPKQSVYRFRRADIGVYGAVCRRIVEGATGARRVELRKSFRAVPSIQQFVNHAFEPLMTGDDVALQAAYVPLEPDRPEPPSQPTVVALPVPAPYAKRFIAAGAVEASLPAAVAAYVEWLVKQSGWTIPGTDRRFQPRDVCILFRRFANFFKGDMTREYAAALDARGIPHVLVGGKTFHAREEIETLRAALTAIEWPDDELSVFATLKGALFAVGDEALVEWKLRYGGFHPFRVPQAFVEPEPALWAADDAPGHLQPIADALVTLQRLHRRRNYRPVPDTITDLLAATRAHVGFVLRVGGEQALANVLQIVELSRQYELAGGLSFRGFVDDLKEAAENDQASEAPILEEGSDGVRMMTVHKAKGLEFPVVVLADVTCRLSRADAGRWVDAERGLCALRLAGWAPADLLRHEPEEALRDEAEGVRLAYVAATRARDLLVVPAVGDEPFDGSWLQPLHEALYPPVSARRDPQPPAGCPAFVSKDSVMNRPDGDPARPTTVAPGAHARPGYSVVWWDPHILDLDADAPLGLSHPELIVRDVDESVVAEGLAGHRQWQASRAAAIDSGRRESMVVKTVTELVSGAPAGTLPAGGGIELIDVARRAGRPAGPRFGTLVHAVLSLVPLDAGAAAVGALADTQGRILDAPPAEIAAAAESVAAVLAHPLMARARAADAAGRLRRELPFVRTSGDSPVLVEGTIDLLIEDEAGALVVDFKTDRELEQDLERYRRQVAFYCESLSRRLGAPAAGAIVRI